MLAAPLRLIATLVQDASQPFAAQFVAAGGLHPSFVERFDNSASSRGL